MIDCLKIVFHKIIDDLIRHLVVFSIVNRSIHKKQNFVQFLFSLAVYTIYTFFSEHKRSFILVKYALSLIVERFAANPKSV